jgi:hypothetical protein
MAEQPLRDSAVVAAFKAKRAAEGRSRCEVCRWKPPKGLSVLHEDPSSMLHAHHVVPLACGGEDHERNLVLVCPTHHALSHKIGRMTVVRLRARTSWDGPRSPAQLLREMRMMEKEPEAWAMYVRAGRNYPALVLADEQKEAERRRSRFLVRNTTDSTTQTAAEILASRAAIEATANA